MQDKAQDPNGQNGEYKSLFYPHKRVKPYTSTRMSFDDYLATDVWRELRNKRLKMDNFQCQKCGTAINLEVHHIRYPKAWGEEDINTDLITLCAAHHAEVHKYDIAKEGTN